MEEFERAVGSLRRGLATAEDDIAQIRRKKAEQEDLEAVSKKVSAVETESREKLSSLNSKLNEVERILNNLVRAVDHLAESLERTKEEVSSSPGVPSARTAPSGTLDNTVSWWDRIPKWAILLMGMGMLAIIQQGPGLFFRMQGISIPGVN